MGYQELTDPFVPLQSKEINALTLSKEIQEISYCLKGDSSAADWLSRAEVIDTKKCM